MNINVLRPVLWLILSLLFCVVPAARAADASTPGDTIHVMEAFERSAMRAEDTNVLNDHKKHVIMFFMGVPLLVLILITAALGIAMVVYGKQVFTMHMIFAGLTATLAVAHLVTGLVWFYPF